jgi:hypothetical protein
VLGLLKPFKAIWTTWRWVGHKIGHVNGLIILTIFYVLVLTPYAWIMRMMRADVINSRPDATRHSYWQHRTAVKPPDSYRRPF